MSFNSQLQKELHNWQEEGLISSETAEALAARYPVTKRSMTQTLALFGSILLGLGVIMFFAANWQVMPRLLKISVVVLSFTLAYGSGYYLRYYQGNYPKVGYALIVLGSLLYGSAIWLIAQIFHLNAETGTGFFLWFLGVIPVAYLFSSSLNLFLALINLAAWFLAGHYPLSLPYLVFPLLLFGTALPLALHKKDFLNFLAVIIAAFIWFVPLGVKLANLKYSFQIGIISILLFSLVLYFASRYLKTKKFFADNLVLMLSFLGLFIGFAPFTFNNFLTFFSEVQALHYYPYLPLMCMLIILIIKFLEKSWGWHDTPLLMLYLLLYLPFGELASSSILLIINNLLFFVLTLLAVYYGYQLKQPLIFNLGIVLFAAAVAMKYFDYFFALMPRSLFFMSGGILLLLGSFFLERKRRHLIKAMERSDFHA